MQPSLSPVLLYAACALGAVGVALALPRRLVSPFIVGALVGGAALVLGLVALGLSGPEHLPNVHFYAFAGLALFGAIRVITHQRPVYSALYFVLTILASAGLYLLLSAEFMAFALVIVYAGAILITYLFVIMLATQAPSSDAVEALNVYDWETREPLVATLAGFVLLGALTTMLSAGTATLAPNPNAASGDAQLAVMSLRVERVLASSTATRQVDGKTVIEPMLRRGERLAPATDDVGATLVSSKLLTEAEWKARTGIRGEEPKPGQGFAIRADREDGWLALRSASGDLRVLRSADWPAGLAVSNTNGVAFELIEGHPGAIEIAGVILLMAMIGAVILARKKVEMDEAAQAEAVARERDPSRGDELGVIGPYAPPGVGEGGSPA